MPSVSAKPLLDVRRLSRRFGGVRAVDDVSFAVLPGQTVSVIGPNGSGKTTLFNLLAGLLRPDAGEVCFDGDPTTGRPAERMAELGVARTFQNGRVFGNMTVRENVLLGGYRQWRAARPLPTLRHVPVARWLPLAGEAALSLLRPPAVRDEERERGEAAERQLARFGERLLPRQDNLAFSLSYANRRRTEIARALAMEPRLLLLDEPTAGMNPTETAEVLDQIRALKAAGQTILLIEHKLDLVMALSDRVLVLDHGQVIARGTPAEIQADQRVVEAYLGRRAAGAATGSERTVDGLAKSGDGTEGVPERIPHGGGASASPGARSPGLTPGSRLKPAGGSSSGAAAPGLSVRMPTAGDRPRWAVRPVVPGSAPAIPAVAPLPRARSCSPLVSTRGDSPPPTDPAGFSRLPGVSPGLRAPGEADAPPRMGAAAVGTDAVTNAASLLQLDGIDAYYGAAQALASVSLAVGVGEIVCLLGGNASGKSTTMKVVLGLLAPRAGRVLLRGEDVTRRSTAARIRAGLASVPEARRLFPEMTVDENLRMGAYLRRDRAEVAADVERMHALFPRLAERRRQAAGTMSGGEQQMLAIARALMGRPRLICMDEPTMGLAPVFVDRVLETIAEINRQGVEVFMVEQNAALALSIADRGYVLQNGAIVLSGRAGDLLNDPAVQQAYLGQRVAS